ncbi:MAG: glyoxylate/hydroxypyruvate reductase A [Flavobacteriales bacterium TMED96]|nr:MAG: glyoxylate/hydroxypyruvate reductase A [Flavobacteriales bacterium TMED96]|tara:strand:+ start:1628 stop:2548 length:921 start_codon:yes stop_codon:yes gene_type:complete
MRFAIIAPPTQTKKWKIEFEKQAPNEELLIGYKTDRPEEIECVMVWGHPKGSLEKFKNLKLIFSMGAGVDHILNDDTIPKNIPISRIVDPQMAFSMTNYVLMAVLNYQRCWYDFQDAQKKNHWAQFEFDEKHLKIGVYGIGHLGMDAANALYRLGFEVFGYSNSLKETIFPSFYGDQLLDFLNKINVFVCTVPLTPKTRGLLCTKFFNKLANPTYLINVSRGAVHVENDIIKAIKEGKLTGAFLDVFEKEPLPKDSPLWQNPKIKITPHIASLTYAEESIRQALENFNRIQSGKKPLNEVSRDNMY